jgi:hypothetical protein
MHAYAAQRPVPREFVVRWPHRTGVGQRSIQLSRRGSALSLQLFPCTRPEVSHTAAHRPGCFARRRSPLVGWSIFGQPDENAWILFAILLLCNFRISSIEMMRREDYERAGVRPARAGPQAGPLPSRSCCPPSAHGRASRLYRFRAAAPGGGLLPPSGWQLSRRPPGGGICGTAGLRSVPPAPPPAHHRSHLVLRPSDGFPGAGDPAAGRTPTQIFDSYSSAHYRARHHSARAASCPPSKD